MSTKSILTNDWYCIPKNEKLIALVDSMQKISSKIEQRVKEVNSDIITTRKDPKIKEFWSELCMLHMKSILICHEEPNQDPKIVNYVTQPQACINFLHLTEEETCCQRNLSRIPTTI
jgi:hypothetical protein